MAPVMSRPTDRSKTDYYKNGKAKITNTITFGQLLDRVEVILRNQTAEQKHDMHCLLNTLFTRENFRDLREQLLKYCRSSMTTRIRRRHHNIAFPNSDSQFEDVISKAESAYWVRAQFEAMKCNRKKRLAWAKKAAKYFPEVPEKIGIAEFMAIWFWDGQVKCDHFSEMYAATQRTAKIGEVLTVIRRYLGQGSLLVLASDKLWYEKVPKVDLELLERVLREVKDLVAGLFSDLSLLYDRIEVQTLTRAAFVEKLDGKEHRYADLRSAIYALRLA